MTLLEPLSTEEREKLLLCIDVTEFGDGEEIMREGEEGDCMCVLVYRAYPLPFDGRGRREPAGPENFSLAARRGRSPGAGVARLGARRFA